MFQNIYYRKSKKILDTTGGFPGGSVVKNLPAIQEKQV